MNREHRLYKPTTTALILVFIVIIISGFFLFLQSKPVFPDPDSFYHIKIAQLIARQGVVESFPWLTFTGLTQYYTDQHFLYHVFLAPFVTALNPIFGAKLATVVINAALFALFAALLIRFRVRSWWVFLLILCVTNPFLFRIGLVKAPGFSLLLLFIGFWLLATRRVWSLAVLSFVYVWAYGGFVLLGVLGVVYAVVATIKRSHERNIVTSVFRRVSLRNRSSFWRVREVQQVGAIAVGTIVGFLVNPYFPKNFFFSWQQLIQIGIVNFQKVVNVGGEWHPYGFVELLANTVFVSIAVLLALVALIVARRRQSTESWTLFFFSVFCFVITLKSRRYVELYVPVATIFAAFALRDAVPLTANALLRRAREILRQRSAFAILLAVYVVGAVLLVVVRDERQLVRDLQSGISVTSFAGASTWIRDHTPKGSIIVHSDWDDFPVLFYHNDHNRYIVGLDPTFMYQHDRVLYERWADLTSGRREDDATQIITQDLQSSVVLVSKDHEPFDRIMKKQTAFTLAYEDDEAKVYVLREAELTQ